MIMIKADYSKIASFYDNGRSLSEQNTIIWLNLISRLSGASENDKVLDLGCGTGRFSLPMVNSLRFDVTGVDSSIEMLKKAKEKDFNSAVNWLVADASVLVFQSGTFNVVFMSHLLHHVDNPLVVLKECNRVLACPGVVLIRYGALEQIRHDVEHTLFPEVIDIDEGRTPSVELTEKWLIDAGFEDISSKEIIQQTYQDGLSHLNAARVKSTSVLSMISEESFQTGIRRLSEYVNIHSKDEWLMFDKMTLTVGYKRAMKI